MQFWTPGESVHKQVEVEPFLLSLPGDVAISCELKKWIPKNFHSKGYSDIPFDFVSLILSYCEFISTPGCCFLRYLGVLFKRNISGLLAGTQVDIWEEWWGKNTRTSGMMDLPFFKKRSSHHENSHGDLVDQFTPKWIKATRSKKYIRYSSYVIYAILLVPFTLSYLCNCDFGGTIVSSDFLPFGSPTLSP